MTSSEATTTKKPRLRWYQFTLRGLLAFMLLACIGLSWLAVKMREARRQREAVKAVTGVGAVVTYDYEIGAGSTTQSGARPNAPLWIRRILGDDFFGRPVELFTVSQTTPELLPLIGRLPSLTDVALRGLPEGSEPFTAINGLSHLSSLELEGPLDFRDLPAIRPMPLLKELALSAPVDDHVCSLIVKKFPRLEDLMTDQGIDTYNLSDNGLAELRHLPRLKTLSINCSPRLSCAGLGIVSGSSELVELEAAFQIKGGEEVARIHDCPRLEQIAISRWLPDIPAQPDVLPWVLCLERVPRLKELRVQDAGSVSLDDVSRLEKLTLTDCYLSAADFAKLVAGDHLVDVELSGVFRDVRSALERLVKVRSLRKINFYTTLTANDIRLLGTFKQLETLGLGGHDNVDDAMLHELVGMRNLRVLKLWGTSVTAAGIQYIEAAIPGLRCTGDNPKLWGVSGGGTPVLRPN
jgi:hypothetical protein